VRMPIGGVGSYPIIAGPFLILSYLFEITFTVVTDLFGCPARVNVPTLLDG